MLQCLRLGTDCRVAAVGNERAFEESALTGEESDQLIVCVLSQLRLEAHASIDLAARIQKFLQIEAGVFYEGSELSNRRWIFCDVDELIGKAVRVKELLGITAAGAFRIAIKLHSF